MHVSITLLAVFLGLFSFLVITLLIIRKTTKRLVEDLNLARHILITWFFTPILWVYFKFLQIFRKIKIQVNGTIPWENGFIVAPNHSMEKLQDTVLLPIIIFFLRPKNYSNPIRYFPTSAADKANFVDTWFGKIIGPNYFMSIDRYNDISRERAKKTINNAKQQYSDILLLNPEYGRTLTAILDKRYREVITPYGKLYLGRLKLGVAELSLQTGRPIIPVWSKLVGEDSYSKVFEDSFRPAKASFRQVFLGLLELLFDYRKKVYIDIGYSDGPLRPNAGEDSKELTERLENILFEVGHLQLKQLKSKR